MTGLQVIQRDVGCGGDAFLYSNIRPFYERPRSPERLKMETRVASLAGIRTNSHRHHANANKRQGVEWRGFNPTHGPTGTHTAT